jgi:hypothetical protein
MSWLFSQVLVEEFSEGICSGGEPFVQSSGSPIPQAYCALDKMKAFSRVSRFGMTFGPLTDDRGEELLTWFRAGFLVKTFPQPEKAQESTESEAECGPKWRGSFARFDPDSYSWRTHQCSLLGGLTEYSETWPRWGSMRNGECWERQTLAHHTNETEFGLWPTPTVCGNYNQKGMSKNSGDGLATAVKKWGNPKAQDSRHARFDRNKGNLGEQVAGLHDGGQLNPDWVEWLMGWPVGWTDLKPLETDKFQKWLDEHSES